MTNFRLFEALGEQWLKLVPRRASTVQVISSASNQDPLEKLKADLFTWIILPQQCLLLNIEGPEFTFNIVGMLVAVICKSCHETKIADHNDPFVVSYHTNLKKRCVLFDSYNIHSMKSTSIIWNINHLLVELVLRISRKLFHCKNMFA